MKKLFFSLGLLCLLLLLTGCYTPKLTSTPELLELKDSSQRIVTIKGTPQRIITLSPSFVQLIEALDGSLVGTASSNLVPTDPDLTKVGFSFNVNTEKILSLQPDLVIGYQGMHERYLPFFAEMNIPVLMLKLKSYQDVQQALQLLGRALQQEPKATAIQKELSHRMAAALSKLPPRPYSLAIVHYSPQGIALETEHSIAGATAKILQMHNVLADAPQLTPLQRKNEFIPYSLEMVIQQNPEIIFVTSMGAHSTVDDYIKKEILENPSWSTVLAVQKQQVYSLPEELFLINPGLRYPEAVAYMAARLPAP